MHRFGLRIDEFRFDHCASDHEDHQREISGEDPDHKPLDVFSILRTESVHVERMPHCKLLAQEFSQAFALAVFLVWFIAGVLNSY
jgi:hypothetical protein